MKIKDEALQAFLGLNEAITQGFRVIYIDEFMTTRTTISKNSWSLKNNPVLIDSKALDQRNVASIMGISQLHGVDLIMNF